MAESLLLLCLLEELCYETEIGPRRKVLRRRKRKIQKENYVTSYRLTEEMIDSLQQELSPMIPLKKKQTGLDLRTKILSTLSFLASGGHQKIVGKDRETNISQASTSRSLHQVIDALNHPDIVTKYIKFPNSTSDRQRNKKIFNEKFGIPDAVGCVGSTLVTMIKPKLNDESYLLHKTHTKHVQLICDADLNIIHVDSTFGGSLHKSYVFDHSTYKTYIEELHKHENIYILGDAEYPQRPYLMTPVANADVGSREAHYNEVHAKAYNSIGQVIDMLKGRFRCLLVNNTMHYHPDMVTKIVTACCVLHNICNEAGLPPPKLTEQDVQNEQKLCSLRVHVADQTHKRNTLINDLWRSKSWS